VATYYARMLDAETNGEGAYTFPGPADLMQRTADEIVAAFFEHVEKEVLKTNADWELNGVMKNKERGIITAIGSPHSGQEWSAAPVPAADFGLVSRSRSSSAFTADSERTSRSKGH
jgi:hypothetical protein